MHASGFGKTVSITNLEKYKTFNKANIVSRNDRVILILDNKIYLKYDQIYQ